MGVCALVRQCACRFVHVCARECKQNYVSKPVRGHVRLYVYMCVNVCSTKCICFCAVMFDCIQKLG